MTINEPITSAGEALAAAAGDLSPDPDVLEQEASALDAAAIDLVSRPGELWAEAASRRALAAALRVRATALEAVAAADAGVARAETAHEETGPAETAAAARAVQARQAFEIARDALERARDTDAPVAELIDLDGRAMSAARVDEWEHGKLAEAQRIRAGAWEAVLRARRARAEARARLDAAQVGVDHPADADLSLGDRFRSLLFCWPFRVLTADSGAGPKLTKAELTACRVLAESMCDLLGGVPPGAEQRVGARVAREVRADMAKMVGLSLAGGPPAGAGTSRALAKAR